MRSIIQALTASLLMPVGALLLACSLVSVSRAADLPPLQPGVWVEVPGSRLRDVAPPSPGGNVSKMIDAWSGGALDPQRGWLLVWGGGHSDYAGNELYAFDVNTLAWNRLTNPSAPNDARTA